MTELHHGFHTLRSVFFLFALFGPVLVCVYESCNSASASFVVPIAEMVLSNEERLFVRLCIFVIASFFLKGNVVKIKAEIR